MHFPFPSCLSRRSLRTLTLASAPLGVLAVGLAGCPSTTNVTTYVPITGIVIRASSLVAGLGCGTGPGQVYRYAAVVRHADDPLGPVLGPLDATVVDAPANTAAVDATLADAPEVDATPADATPADATPAATPADAAPADASFVVDGATDGAAPVETADAAPDAASSPAVPTHPAAMTVENDPAAGVWVNVFDCFTDGVFENLPASADGSLAFTVSIFAYDKAAYDATMLPASLSCPPAAAGQLGGCGVPMPVDESAATWSALCSATQQSGTPVLAVCSALQPTGAGAGDDADTGSADGATDAGPVDDAAETDASVLDAAPRAPDASDAASTGSDASVNPGDGASPDAADSAGALDAAPNDG